MVERLGSNEQIPLDLRVVAASRIDLKGACDANEFRTDLYYRLNVVTIEIPPLRDRKEDIPLLFHHFLLISNNRYQREAPPPKTAQIRVLLSHPWPDNVRELQNVAERYVLLGHNSNYDLEELMHGQEGAAAITLPEQVECFEKSAIEQSLAANKGSIKDTMDALGVPRKTLYDKMSKYHLDKDNYKS